MGGAPWRTVRTAASARRRGTTRRQAPTRAAPWHTARTARAVPRRPITLAPARTAQTRQGSGVYGSWGSTSVQRGDDWAQTSRVTNRATGNTTRVTRTDEGGMVSHRGGPGGGGFVAAGDEGNVYAGHDGNVYKRQEGGGWQKYDNGGWTNTDKPAQGGGTRERPTQPTTTDRSATPTQRSTGTTSQLDRDRAARTEGATRTSDYGSYRGGGGSAGSYRATPSRGGGGRGGGRRR